jgi:solute:Na+ symporter, SSS family
MILWSKCCMRCETHCQTVGRTLFLLAAGWAAAGASFASAAETATQVASELRQKATGTLRRTLDHQQRWGKVHAAEYLLALDYSQGVKQAFLKELDVHGTELQYRIGIWRVLARSAGSDVERACWIEKIRNVAFDVAAKDRIHASDTLAKLGCRISEAEEVESLQEAGQPDRGEMAGHSRWILANGTGDERVQAAQTLARIGDQRDMPVMSGLLTVADPDLRAAAAYAILRIDRRQPHYLAAWDWLVIGAYLVGMLSVGWYYSRRTKTQEQYLLGDRHMSPLMVGVSLFASLFSCISYLATPGEIIKYGPMIIGDILAYPLIGLIIGWLIIPFIMKLKVTSAYEILELRFGPAVRTLGSLLFLSLRLMWMSVIVYAMTTKVLVPLSGLPSWTIPWMCALLAFVTIVYTAMGGLRAVVVTDVIQAAILFGAAIVTVITITVCLGGVHAWWPSHWPAHWPEPRFGYDPSARVPLLIIMLSTVTWYVCTSASDQIAVQRYLSTKDAKAARTVLFVSLLAGAFVSLLLATVALALLAYFQTYPHLLPDGQPMLADSDKLFPQFIIIGLPVGLSGLVVAGLLACAMSALSAGINSTCSVLTVDIIDRLRGKNKVAEAGRVGQLKHVSYLIGAIVVGLSFFVNMVQGNLVEICYKVVSLLTAPLAGLFLLAMFVPWARTFGAWVGAVCGLVVAIVVAYWKEITGAEGVSFLWAMPLSLMVEIGVGSLVSLLPIGQPAAPLDQVV